MSFHIGQRFGSDTENELGLGIVVAVDNRSLTLFFPATNEQRIYSKQAPSLTRIIYSCDDIITTTMGWQFKIQTYATTDPVVVYSGIRLDTQESPVLLNEADLESRVTFSNPTERLFAKQFDTLASFILRYQAYLYNSEQYSLPWFGLRGFRTDLLPHQLHIAQEVSQRYAPRVLLADEVGLGKTIEAGMIIHKRLITGVAKRILIIVPETLQHQWIVEMLRRFNLHFSLFDDERYEKTAQDEENPFESEQWIICSLEFAQKESFRLTQLTQANWDMLVVDEAHNLSWHVKGASQSYLCIEQLAQNIPSVLLLTATPEQLGQESHFARLRLLDPHRFHSYATFLDEQQQYQPVAEVVAHLLDKHPIEEHRVKQLRELLHTQDIELLLTASKQSDDGGLIARQELIQLLIDRHGTSRILFRNSRTSVQGFPKRKLYAVALSLPECYHDLLQTLPTPSTLDTDGITRAIQTHLTPEVAYQASLATLPWYQCDPRVSWLIQFLLQHRQDKVLLICQHATTVLALENILRTEEGLRAALFHEGLSLLERDRSAAYFASTEEGAQILLCSEIGSEGRNFQFSHHLILFDLPSNPDLLEQRIGRLDRIGQTHDIEIFVPYLEESAQARLFTWYHNALNAFEETNSIGAALYTEQQQNLFSFLLDTQQTANARNAFIEQCREQHAHFRQQLEQGRDYLLEYYSQGGETAKQLAQQIAQQDNDPNLINFSGELFELIGLHQEEQHERMRLTPTDTMLFPDFPGLPQEGCTITFNRQTALSYEDSQFITWEHPFIQNGIDLITTHNIGRCVVAALPNPALPVGTLFLELIYLIETQAPKKLQLQRFLPLTPIRLLLDAKGNDFATKIGFERLSQQLKPINKQNTSKIITNMQSTLLPLFKKGEGLMTFYTAERINFAKQHVDATLTKEQQRLLALQSINPNIRDDEIIQLEENRSALLEAVDKANYRLDALRVILVTHPR